MTDIAIERMATKATGAKRAFGCRALVQKSSTTSSDKNITEPFDVAMRRAAQVTLPSITHHPRTT